MDSVEFMYGEPPGWMNGAAVLFGLESKGSSGSKMDAPEWKCDASSQGAGGSLDAKVAGTWL